MRDRLDLRAVAILVLCCLVWGFNQTAIKVANAGISPFLQAGLRSLLAGALLLVWMKARGTRIFQRDGTLWWGLLIGLLFAGEFVFLYSGLQFTRASRGVIFLYSAPFIVSIGAHYLIPNDKLTWAKSVGLISAFIGVVLALGDGLSGQSGPVSQQWGVVGDVYCFIGAIMWGAVTLIIRLTPLAAISPDKTLLYQHAVTASLLPGLSLLTGEPGITDLTPVVLSAFAYTVIIVAFASYATWFWLLRTYPASQLSAFTFLAPVFGVAGGALMLGEPLTPTLLGALSLVAFGLWLINANRGLRAQNR